MSVFDKVVYRVRCGHQIAVSEELSEKHRSAEGVINSMSNVELLRLISDALEEEEGEA